MEEIRLRSGRRLAYAQWGDPGGHPVMHCHGTPGSRFQRYPNDAATRTCGIRFIVPERPGYGRSEPVESYSLLAGADDIGQLADHLGIDRFAVHGISGGGPFALAVAWQFGARVTRAAVLACLGPLDRPDALDGMWEANAAIYRVAMYQPDRLAELLDKDEKLPLPKGEHSALARVPGLLRLSLAASEEVFRQGHHGVAIDYLTLLKPWPFPLEQIRRPVALWHGVSDALVPIQNSDYLAARLPNATLHRCAGEMHFSMFKHQREVLAYLAGSDD
jgi:pimeloyl-ACP methyl ester carboxylesterase